MKKIVFRANLRQQWIFLMSNHDRNDHLHTSSAAAKTQIISTFVSFLNYANGVFVARGRYMFLIDHRFTSVQHI